MAGNEEALQFVLRMRDEASTILASFGNQMQQTAGSAEKTQSEFDKLSFTLGKVAAAYGLMKGAAAAFRAEAEDFAKFQSAMTKTGFITGMSGEALDKFGHDLLFMSAKIPLATDELFKLAQVASKAGIEGTAGLEQFAKEVGKVSKITGIEAGHIATSLTQMISSFDEAPETAGKLGNALVQLQNRSRGTAEQIMNMGVMMSRNLGTFKITSGEVLALSATISDLGGGRPQQTVMAVTRVIEQMAEATEKDNVKMFEFAKAMGMSRSAAADLIKTNPVEAFIKMSTGLAAARKEGQEFSNALKTMGISATILDRSILPFAQNVDKYRSHMKVVAGDTSNAENATKQFQTAMELLKGVTNQMNKNFDTMAVLIGEQLAPKLTAGIKLVRDTVAAFNEWYYAFAKLNPALTEFLTWCVVVAPAIGGVYIALRAVFMLLGAGAAAGIIGSIGVVVGLVAAFAGGLYYLHTWLVTTEDDLGKMYVALGHNISRLPVIKQMIELMGDAWGYLASQYKKYFGEAEETDDQKTMRAIIEKSRWQGDLNDALKETLEITKQIGAMSLESFVGKKAPDMREPDDVSKHLQSQIEMTKQMIKAEDDYGVSLAVSHALIKQRSQDMEKLKREDSEHMRLSRELAELTYREKNAYTSAATGLKSFTEEFARNAMNMGKATQDFMKTTMSSIENSIADMVMKGKADWRSLIQTILTEALKLYAIRPLLAAGLNILGGASLPGGPSLNVAGVPGSANGNVFGFSAGSAFLNSVVSSPTFFKFMSGGAMQNGVMGEAGPEAVMPLRRDSQGNLGVMSRGGGGGGSLNYAPEFHFHTDGSSHSSNAPDAAAHGDAQRLTAALDNKVKAAVIEVLQQESRSGGMLARTMVRQ